MGVAEFATLPRFFYSVKLYALLSGVKLSNPSHTNALISAAFVVSRVMAISSAAPAGSAASAVLQLIIAAAIRTCVPLSSLFFVRLTVTPASVGVRLLIAYVGGM